MNQEYELTVTISKFEFYFIQKMRMLQQHGFGEINAKFNEGQCVDIKNIYHTHFNELKNVQKLFLDKGK